MSWSGSLACENKSSFFGTFKARSYKNVPIHFAIPPCPCTACKTWVAAEQILIQFNKILNIYWKIPVVFKIGQQMRALWIWIYVHLGSCLVNIYLTFVEYNEVEPQRKGYFWYGLNEARCVTHPCARTAIPIDAKFGLHQWLQLCLYWHL
jgi:hypothetical protein